MASDSDNTPPTPDRKRAVEDDDEDMDGSTTPSEGNKSPNLEHQQPAGKRKDRTGPKRKKARRACLACQKGHLTCDDGRPCQKCVSRGRAEDCVDGKRKKAKYLRDTPSDALPHGTIDQHDHPKSKQSHLDGLTGARNEIEPLPQVTAYPSHEVQPSYPFNSGPNPVALRPDISEPATYMPQADGALSTSSRMNSQPQPHFHNIEGGFQPALPVANPTNTEPYNGSLFNPLASSLFNVDSSGMDFGNHLGAMEFDILGQMSLSNGGDFGSLQNAGSIRPGGQDIPQPYGTSPTSFIPVNQPYSNVWAPLESANTDRSIVQQPFSYNSNRNPFTMPAGPDTSIRVKAAPSLSEESASPVQDREPGEPVYVSNTLDGEVKDLKPKVVDKISKASDQNKRRVGSFYLKSRFREKELSKLGYSPPSTIYSSKHSPYPYVEAYHKLFDFLRRRFSGDGKLELAVIREAVAKFRPNFVFASFHQLHEDLEYNEKFFQRQLYEYAKMLITASTPTIICRRTGEVAEVGGAFTQLTGWRRNVLLGREPNLNVNNGIDYNQPSGTATGTSSRGGFNTPRAANDLTRSDAASGQSGKPQAVFLWELLDDKNIVKFFQDFATHAYADSKGDVYHDCKVFKYKTKEDMVQAVLGFGGEDKDSESEASQETLPDLDRFRRNRIAGRAPLGAAAQRQISKYRELEDSWVDCQYCWRLRRDAFGSPMMIVWNFLPKRGKWL